MFRAALHAMYAFLHVKGSSGSAVTPDRHASQSRPEYESAKNRVLVLGAGFGGMMVARALKPAQTSDVSILVVDRANAQLFTPLLWTVAEGRASPGDIMVPVRGFQRGRSFHVLHSEVKHIDLDRREVLTAAGTYTYDVAVIALGSVTAVPDIPGLRQYGHLFRTPTDALELRNHVISALESAHQSTDPTVRDSWLTFAVGGGGDTGVELAATIRDYATGALFSSYPWLAHTPIRVVLIERLDRLTPMGSERSSRTVQRLLQRQGIEIWTGTDVEGVTADRVSTSRGELACRTMFWAAGITAPDVVRALPVEHAPNGSIIVDDRLCIPEHPEVFVIGDSAWAHDPATRAPIPPTAQGAEREARFVAAAIAARLAGAPSPAFRFSSRGHLTLLGRHTGLAEIGPFRLTGLPAWLLWHGYYLSHVPSWRNRIYLLVSWSLAAVFGQDTSQLPLTARVMRDGKQVNV